MEAEPLATLVVEVVSSELGRASYVNIVKRKGIERTLVRSNLGSQLDSLPLTNMGTSRSHMTHSVR